MCRVLHAFSCLSCVPCELSSGFLFNVLKRDEDKGLVYFQFLRKKILQLYSYLGFFSVTAARYHRDVKTLHKNSHFFNLFRVSHSCFFKLCIFLVYHGFEHLFNVFSPKLRFNMRTPYLLFCSVQCFTYGGNHLMASLIQSKTGALFSF